MRVSYALPLHIVGNLHNKLKKKITGYSYTFSGALIKKSTLNVNRKMIPETPPLPPCCSSNITSIFPPQGLCPCCCLFLEWFSDIHMACCFTPSALCSKVILTILYKTAKPQHTHTSTLYPSPLPALYFSTAQCPDIQNVWLLYLSPTKV